jgi:SAM-dependent methyltransferase
MSRADAHGIADTQEVTPDGSPVPVYRALPAEPGFTPLLEALQPPASVLDLGCGTGRLANLLTARGFTVTGVDASPAMLAGLSPAVRPVRARIEELKLEARFDVVVLASQLVNEPDPGLRRALLAAAAQHVTVGGAVFLEHLDPALLSGPRSWVSMEGSVDVHFRLLAVDGARCDGEVRYALGDRAWIQRFTAVVLDDATLERELAAVGLASHRRLSPRWLQTRRASSAVVAASETMPEMTTATEPRSSSP